MLSFSGDHFGAYVINRAYGDTNSFLDFPLIVDTLKLR